MTITIDDVYKELEQRIKSAFNDAAISKKGNHIEITSKHISGKNVQTKINFHPEVVKSNQPTQPTKLSDNVFIYPSNGLPRPASVSIDIGIAQIVGHKTATRFPIIRNDDGTLNAEWDTIATGAVRDLKQKLDRCNLS